MTVNIHCGFRCGRSVLSSCSLTLVGYRQIGITRRNIGNMPSKVHDVAAGGFAEGTNDIYDKARPSYPSSTLNLIHSILSPPNNNKPLTIIEPGSGTGIFSRLLLYPPTPDYPTFDNLETLIGVEPSKGMRDSWERGLEKVPTGFLPPDYRIGTVIETETGTGTGVESVTVTGNGNGSETPTPTGSGSGDESPSVKRKRVQVVDGGFDDFSKTGIQQGSVDAVIIAQAFHWCPDYSAALTEIARYLSPCSPLILIWNHDSPSVQLSVDLKEIYKLHDRGTPQFYRMTWKTLFDTEEYKQLYLPAEQGINTWTKGITEDQLIERIFSKSFLTKAYIDGEPRLKLEQQLRKVIQDSDKEWIDKEQGIFLYKYDTHHVILRKKP
ncbi:hypothetical protein BCR39DRAFT_347137 [Naematelia encephala]|uniref:Methyltransferase type 11 domain-containing protein n=1 Tax=Naematelia encephala TaxID=71784 RepID=A0A1Y2AMS7_9TREE|nr:hypothetical protein BCR39DRAFT_347137 [Naematelia encephala]